MESFYSLEQNVLNLVALLKAHNIRKVVASPGTTDVNFIVSLQNDSFFEIYSCIDERSAAFMACGMAAESGEPVVITCTEATASRNYYPAITEAFHRKLPILAVTGLHDYANIGNLVPQVIDRSESPADTFKLKVDLPAIKDEKDVKQSVFLINKALLELNRRGGGPVHINLPSLLKMVFTQKDLPSVNVINRYTLSDSLPAQIREGKVAIFCGTHAKWDETLVCAVESFCKSNDAIVLGSVGCGYYGKYLVQTTLAGLSKYQEEIFDGIETLIHIGQEAADYKIEARLPSLKEVWRVDSDGELRDYFGKLSKVFEMDDRTFFERYAKKTTATDSRLKKCAEAIQNVENRNLDYPFSNVYAASKVVPCLPINSVLHLGLSNTLRAWMMFRVPEGVESYCNLGTRGIDGCVSTLIGASQVRKDKIYFGVFGDLTFLYDMNVIANRHIGSNVRIMLINNNGGCLFRTWGHKILGEDFLNQYIAASGHMSAKSRNVVQHYCEDMGFEYLTASDKEGFEMNYRRFVSPEMTDKPIFFELFTEPEKEMSAFSLSESTNSKQWKQKVKGALGEKGASMVKRLFGK